MAGSKHQVCVVGAGTMGQGIAQVALAAGHAVGLVDLDAEQRDRAAANIERRLRQRAPEVLSVLRERLHIAASVTTLPAKPDTVVIEAVVEQLAVKQAVLQDALDHFGPHSLAATNTSSLSITEIAAGVSHPERVIGLHFFNPVPAMRLVEIVPGLQTDPAIVEQMQDLVVAWGKTPTIAKSTPGFIVNRVARPFYGEALRLAEERIAPIYVIDQLLRDAGGFRMGPFELMDLVGNDVNETVTRTVWQAFNYDPRFAPSLIQRELVAAGRLGRKSGRGFYDYERTEEGNGHDPGSEPDSPKLTVTEPARPLELCGESTDFMNILTRSSVGFTTRARSGADDATVLVHNVGVIRFTRGRTAQEEANACGTPVVLLDRALDVDSAQSLAFSTSDDSEELAGITAGVLRSAGIRDHHVADVPGLVVARVVSMVINEAAEALRLGVASAADIDTAMRLGTNYPIGPLAWADHWSPRYVLAVLDALHDEYRDTRYRASQLIRSSVRHRDGVLAIPTSPSKSREFARA